MDLSVEPTGIRDDVHFEIRSDAFTYNLDFVVGTSGLSIPIDCELAVDWRLVAFQFAGLLQDAVVEQSTTAVPRCPGHNDLMVPDFVNYVPMWICSRCHWRAPFGAYWSTARN